MFGHVCIISFVKVTRILQDIILICKSSLRCIRAALALASVVLKKKNA